MVLILAQINSISASEGPALASYSEYTSDRLRVLEISSVIVNNWEQAGRTQNLLVCSVADWQGRIGFGSDNHLQRRIGRFAIADDYRDGALYAKPLGGWNRRGQCRLKKVESEIDVIQTSHRKVEEHLGRLPHDLIRTQFVAVFGKVQQQGSPGRRSAQQVGRDFKTRDELGLGMR